MEKIIGLIDAPFTPFHENGDINLEPIAAYGAMLKKKAYLLMVLLARATCSQQTKGRP